MNLFDLFAKFANKNLFNKITKFTFFIMCFWGIPSFLIFTLYIIYLTNYNQVKNIQKHKYLEDKLDEIIVKSNNVNFFENLLNKIVSEYIFSLPIKKESFQVINNVLSKYFPSGFVELYLFDKNKKFINYLNLSEEKEAAFNLLFDEITTDWYKYNVENPEIIQKISFVIPNAQQILKILKGRNKKLMVLGGKTRYSLGYYSFYGGTSSERIAGCLFFLHLENLPSNFVLLQVLKEYPSNNFGFISLLDGKKFFKLPEYLKFYNNLQSFMLNNLKEYKQKFFIDEYLVITKNIGIQTVLIAVEKVGFPYKLYYVLGLIFQIILGIPIFLYAYRYYFWDISIKFSINYKLKGYFISAFGVPFVALGILIKLITNDIYTIELENLSQIIMRNLVDIDEKFNNYIKVKNYKYQNITSSWQSFVQSPTKIASYADYYYFKDMWDYVHIIASSGKYLVKQPLTPVVVRYTFFLPRSQREEILRLWVDRGGSPPWKDIIRLRNGMSKKEELFISYITDFENMIRQASIKASELAIERYNQINNVYIVPVSEAKKATNAIVQTILESEATILLDAIQKSFKSLVYVEGNKDAGVIYLDVLAGPTGEGWYSVIIFTNLLSYEYKFLENFYKNLGFYKKMLNYYDFDIRAISFHSQAPNYPNLWDYKEFTDFYYLLEVSKNVFQKKVKLSNGKTYLACVLPCNYLKHYYLIGLIDLETFDRSYYRFTKLVWLCYLLASGICISIMFYLSYRFLLPIQYLTLGVKALKQKNYHYKIPVYSSDELGYLSKTFNETIVKLQELEIAHIIQSQLLPQKTLQVGDFQLNGINVMHQLVGGDYFDFIILPNDLIAVIIADVAGHGMSAALVTAMAKSAFNILCLKYPQNPEIILEIVNMQMLLQLKKSKMMTCFIGILDLNNKKIVCSNAAQCAPILIRNKNTVEFIKLNSTPLGVKQKVKLASTVIDMKNSELILYSDGVVEEENDKHEMFGYERLKHSLEIALKDGKDDIINHIISELVKFSGDTNWEDDVTIVSVKHV